jgi:hypothetical protein
MPIIQLTDIGAIKPNPANAHTHSKKQIRQIVDSISAFGFLVPILIDPNGTIVAGHGRLEAARFLGLKQVPVIRVEGLSTAKVRALALADNKISENAGWDREKLAVEIPDLAELLISEGLDISLTGFSAPEIDQIVTDFEDVSSDPADASDPAWAAMAVVSQRGDLWQLGNHRLACGDARDKSELARLMGRRRAAMAFLDPPYNVRVGDIVGRGHIKHREFAMASGEPKRHGTGLMPSAEVGGAERRNCALNCWPWVRSLTHSPVAVIHSPAAMVAAWPTTVTTSRCPRALMRRTQKPFSALW